MPVGVFTFFFEQASAAAAKRRKRQLDEDEDEEVPCSSVYKSGAEGRERERRKRVERA